MNAVPTVLTGAASPCHPAHAVLTMGGRLWCSACNGPLSLEAERLPPLVPGVATGFPRWEDQDHGTNDADELRAMFRKRLRREPGDCLNPTCQQPLSSPAGCPECGPLKTIPRGE